MRTPSMAIALGVIMAWALAGTRAHAESLIAVAGLPEGSPLAEQLRLDLSMLGFAVEHQSDVPDLKAARDLAHTRNAAAVILVQAEAGGEGSEVWIVDRVTGKTVQRRYASSADLAGDDARILSQKIIELLRASFRELDPLSTPKPEADPVVPVAVAALIAPPQAPRAGVALAAAWLTTVGDVAAHPTLVADLHLLVHRHWSLGLNGILPLGSGESVGPEGSADIRPWVLALSGRRAFGVEAGWRIRPHVGLAVGVLKLDMEGRALDPFVGVDDTLWRPIATAQAGVVVPLWPRGVGLRLDVLIGATLPQARIEFDTRRAAVWGLPMVMFAAGVDLQL